MPTPKTHAILADYLNGDLPVHKLLVPLVNSFQIEVGPKDNKKAFVFERSPAVSPPVQTMTGLIYKFDKAIKKAEDHVDCYRITEQFLEDMQAPAYREAIYNNPHRLSFPFAGR